MTLSNRAIKFINEYSEDIDNNKFDNLYSDLTYEDDEEVTPEITAAFQSCDIDPLPTLEFIPADYFRKLSLGKKFVIPKNIKTVGSYSFEQTSGVETVFIPDGCKNIFAAAFHDSKDLKHIYIPYSVNTFGSMCIPSYVTIHCVKNSVAEEYAIHNKCNYEYDYMYPGETI
jgi:hypothetical protein